MRFTALTATYNRGPYLRGVYDSLCAQTFRDFEWVIVDDGSTDGTENLVSSWKAFFPIRYTWKPNGGKHTAVNVGAQQAAGEFTLILDSDERCVPHSLERFDYHWRQIADPSRFASLVALLYSEGAAAVLGDNFPQEVIDVFNLGQSLSLCPVDRGGIVRTDVLRKFPYPVFKNERDMLEGVVWNRILRRYGARYVNEPLKVAGYAPGGLTSQRDRRRSAPKGAALYHAELALSNVPFKLRLKSGINAARFAALAGFRMLQGK